MSSWILFVPADPPVAVTDVCLGKIVPLVQDAVKSLQDENRTSRLRCGYCAIALIILTCFVVYNGFVIY